MMKGINELQKIAQLRKYSIVEKPQDTIRYDTIRYDRIRQDTIGQDTTGWDGIRQNDVPNVVLGSVQKVKAKRKNT